MLRLLTATMAVLFLVGAAVQYNDPDPFRWIAIYLAAATACLLALFHRTRWWVPAAIGVVALAWALALAPGAFFGVCPGQLFATWKMANPRVEEGREMYGLLVIFIYMTVLAVTHRRRGA